MLKTTISKNYILLITLLLVTISFTFQYNLTFSQSVREFSHPVWSPDGEYIAFAMHNDEGHEILQLKMDDRTLTSLTHEVAKGSVWNIVWSPNGNYLAYTVVQDNWDIWVVPVAEGQPFNLTSNIAGASDYPAWSLNGDKIAFAVSEHRGLGNPINSAIWVADITTGDITQLTPDENCYSEPEWVLADNLIAFIGFSCRPTDNDGIYLNDGLFLHDFSRDEITPISYGQAITFAFSPSEEYIAVTGLRPDNNTLEDLVILGDRMRVILTQDTAFQVIREINWSPDEEYLVFTTICNQGYTIATISISNHQISEIASCTNEGFFNMSPVWSPDGRTIAYQSNRAGRDDIWLYSLDTQEHINLTEGL